MDEVNKMIYLWYFTIVAWIVPCVLVGTGLHNGLIGFGMFIAAVIIQTWVCAIAYLLRETKRK
jgi:hypothetical protein